MNGKEYLIVYDTRFGFVNEVKRVYEVKEKQSEDSQELIRCEVEIIKAGTIKDRLKWEINTPVRVIAYIRCKAEIFLEKYFKR